MHVTFNNLRWVFIALLCYPTFCHSQLLPPIQNFSPSDYNAENQNWAISQSKDKIMYIANNRGLLKFNGATWNLYQTPNETIMRAVQVVDNKIYTGSYKEFGYWQENELGILHYTSLSKNIESDLLPDEEFWNILVMNNYVVFQSLKRIYIYNLSDNSVKYIDSISITPKIFNLDESIYFQRVNEGIFRLENGKEVLIYDHKVVKEDEVVNMFQKDNYVLILTRNNGFYKIENNTFLKWPTSAEGLLSRVSVYSAIQLKDNGFALGTIANGLIQLDSNGGLLYHIDQINGLRNNTVLSLYEDFDSNIWLGLDNGLSFIDSQSPFKEYNDHNGTVGSVYAAVTKDGNLYLGTNQGLFYKRLNTDENFNLVAGTQGQVWSLSIIQKTLFCGHHNGTFIINGNSAKKIAAVQGTWKIAELANRSDLLLQGNYDGLYVLQKSNGSWLLRNKIKGFNYSSRYFEPFMDALFVNHEYNGVFKVGLDSSFAQVTSVYEDTLIQGANSGLVTYGDKLLYAYKKGIFTYDNNRRSWVKDTLLSKSYSEEDYVSGKMIWDSDHDYLWVFSNSKISYITPGTLDDNPIINSIPLTESMRNGVQGYESVVNLDGESSYLFGTSNGFITADIAAFQEKDFNVNISSITTGGKYVASHQKSVLTRTTKAALKNHQNNLEFTYYTPEFDKYLKPNYQYQLLGMYPKWSEWSERSSVSFENLPYGSYTFKVRSVIGGRVSNNIASYSFDIARPWYLSNLFLVFYVFGAIFCAVLIHYNYRRYYNKRQQLIIAKSKREMELAKVQNEKEIIKIKNKQLKQEFKSKNNELAASTLSLIKKNELLYKVKDQLVSNVTEKETLKPIIDVIDKNLNQSDDWELFKEAFNNADRKFLKKLKKAHPNLSPNDIRLCAYLRLNLSSKEIAPLLNISARSVEIKRYRLRKKMNLSHDDNLVKYILTL
ncbi:MAG: LuxR family transcriptional regulator [Croceitalea sp.]|nr:LuxR family transcriptional regulator [Croceitalea sp.]